ncbi:MAG: hypothetical protein COA55_07730 [Alcanivorax sp.]|nr:MAG: hypothetical protein COA55_07730 [Alcanivorax sp.]
MSLIECTDGEWQQAQDGAALCTGTLEVVAGSGPFGLPPLTYEEANAILGAVVLLFATVWGVKTLSRLITQTLR